MTNEELIIYAMREVEHLYAALNTDSPRVETFTRYDDGMDIPASTQIEVIVRLVHKPDPEITPELEMEAEFNPT